jgi:hypothetical protein
MSGVYDTPYYENPSADFHNKSYFKGIILMILKSQFKSHGLFLVWLALYVGV